MLACGDDKVRMMGDRTGGVAALVWVSGHGSSWAETLCDLRDSAEFESVVVAFDKRSRAPRIGLGADFEAVGFASLVDALDQCFAEKSPSAVFVIVAPVALPERVLENARDWLAKDGRIGTVSFLSNSAGGLSFPYHNAEVPVGAEGHNERTLTAELRSRGDARPVPITAADGAAILVSILGWQTFRSGGREISFRDPRLVLAALSLDGPGYGYVNVVDVTTFITRSWDWSGPSGSVLRDRDYRSVLDTWNGAALAAYDIEVSSHGGALADELSIARARTQGLRVLIDGSCLGPQEMGTQLLTVALSRSLAAQKGIRAVYLAVPDPSRVPAYVQPLRQISKITFVSSGGLHFPDAPEVDIIHRPYQPHEPIPWERWRALGKRIVVTIQDLIAYRNGSYFQKPEDWLEYRANLSRVASRADGVMTISRDVVAVMRQDRLLIDEDRLHVAENGVDYRDNKGKRAEPAAFVQRGWTDKPFLFSLGATYAHKNRDVSIRVWQSLKARGHDLRLVLAGATVPFGSSRQDEARLLIDEPDVLRLADITGEERDWLFDRASLIMYPTSAEGFGLVPSEVARFDKAALYVAFGPLAEFIDDPDAPKGWGIEELADRAERLISDPAVRRQAILAASEGVAHLTWDRCAGIMVDAYQKTLALSPNQH